ncbi:MAG TPA: hypothetical protein GXX37_13905 [Clostridiaceae bacterium]|nr:hypothetical protein [Clostridiaceae bacterium]
MIEKYGNEFTAAAMELYREHLFLLLSAGKLTIESADESPGKSAEEQQEVFEPLILIHEIEPPLLIPDMSIGIDVIPDYVDDELLIFHGYFGLFVYDLKDEKIIFAADLKKAVGTTTIQGSEGVVVRVSADGNIIQLYYYPEQGGTKMSYTIDRRSGKYTYDYYYAPILISPYFSPPEDAYNRFSGATLGELTYTDGRKSWLIFKDWNWAN